MAYIKHYFQEEWKYEECCDRGMNFFSNVLRNVEHFVCSHCGHEVNKGSKFCSECGEKLTSVREVKESHNCAVCGSKFEKHTTDSEDCCPRCRRLIKDKWGSDLAKAFYELGAKSQKGSVKHV